MDNAEIRDVAARLELKEELHAVLKEYHAANRMRNTPEREAMVDIIYFSPTLPRHFTVEELYSQFSEGRFRVALSTVYNNMPLLVNAGLLKVLYLGPTVCYERCYREAPHAHAVCRCCGKVWDVPRDRNVENLTRVKVKGFRWDAPEMVLTGTCTLCRRKLRKKQKK